MVAWIFLPCHNVEENNLSRLASVVISADLPRRTLKQGTGSNREVKLMPLSCNGGALEDELYQSHRDSRSSVFS